MENVVNPIQTDSWRNLSKFRFSLVSQIGDLKRQTICVLDKPFPEYQSEKLNEFQLQSLLAHISFVEEQVSRIDSKIAELLEEFKSPITTIPGIGNVISATILSEVGDISRFSSPAKLVAYAGLDAKISQSGTSQNSTGKMTKRGSPYLRIAIFRAAFIASNSDPVFKAFYEKKKSEGKHHLTCIGAVACKLCYTIHAILSKNSPYEILS